MIVRVAAVAALLVSTGAFAADPGADKPIIGPVPAWVRPVDPPADDSKPDSNAIKLLLTDQQVRLLPNGSETYSETAARVQTAQGLAALGTISIPWKPDQGTLTVHKMHVIRDGKVIDLLAGGRGFTVLRRENGLEYAMLDGVLTAVIQPEGLQVGDIIDMAMTVKTIEPALGGNSEGFVVLAAGAHVAKYRMRTIWDDSLAVRWREGENLPPIHPRKENGVNEIALALDNVEPTVPPKQAPLRYALTRNVEITTLKSWNQLSLLFAPLYAKASTLKADSPLKAEIASIAAASSDPVKRTEAALALVQDKVRYVFLGMNDGGLVPADADVTWQRRFADCKGKTALLIALLNGLGIAAEPAIVSTALGDGLDERLPMSAFFNHVIVRATIGGKVYWLDGTRLGDTRLADIRVPDFHFALPLRAPGATLEPLAVPTPAKPLQEYRLRVDMTAGVTQPFPFHVEELSRGDEALMTHLRFDNMTPQVRQQSLRDYFAGEYPDVEPKSYSAAWDAATGEEKLVMDGLEKHDWHWSYEVDHAAVGWKADFARAAGAHADAPFQVDYPAYTVAHETILLPNGGKGMVNQAPDIDRTVAGVEYHRKAKLEGATFTIDTSTRAIAREFPAKDAPSAQAALRELNTQQPLLAFDGNYQPTPREVEASVNDPKNAYDFLQRAQARLKKNDLAGALADADQSITLQPNAPLTYLVRGMIRGLQGKPADALPDFQKAVAIGPAWQPAHVALAGLLMNLGRNDEALAEVERAAVLDPKDYKALALRGDIHRHIGKPDQALADAAAALKIKPDAQEIYEMRTNIYVGQGQSDKAIAEARAGVAANPKSEMAHLFLAATYKRFGRTSEAMEEFDRSIAIKPTPQAYLTRANSRPDSDIAGQRADIAAAAKLDPTVPDVQEMSLRLDLKQGNYSAVIAQTSAMLAKKPANGALLVTRGIAYLRTRRQADADRDFAAARVAAGKDANALNSLCWSKATHNAALASALADCDAALKIQPDMANVLDSRGFVLLRLGRYQDAADSYDRALALRPKASESLYGRGLARRHLGKTADGDADLAAAKAVNPSVEEEFKGYGITG